jgi:tetratricopeptide (TPR) repeat protein
MDSTEDRESAYELLQRGSALLKQRHYAQAATVLERADREEPGKASILEALLEIDPSAHYAHFALGQSLKQLGQKDQAWTHLRLAVALHPTSKIYAGALARLGSRRQTLG